MMHESIKVIKNCPYKSKNASGCQFKGANITNRKGHFCHCCELTTAQNMKNENSSLI